MATLSASASRRLATLSAFASRRLVLLAGALSLSFASSCASAPPAAPLPSSTETSAPALRVKAIDSAPALALEPTAPPAPSPAPARAPDPPPVTLDALEVTFKDYRRCVDAHQCSSPAGGWRGTPDLPATGVTLDQAAVYCVFAGARLPTDREWTEAAAAAHAQFPWGDDPFGGRSNCARSEAGYQLIPPGRRKDDVVNGIFDLHGNAMEWTSDRTVRGSRFCGAPLGFSETPPATHSAYVGFRCVAKQ